MSNENAASMPPEEEARRGGDPEGHYVADQETDEATVDDPEEEAQDGRQGSEEDPEDQANEDISEEYSDLEDDDDLEEPEESEEEDAGAREDKSMVLEPEERTWALEVKRLVEASCTLRNLSDMEYAQHAIVARGNAERALKRIEGLQLFRDTYKIDDSPDQGIHCIEEFNRQLPGVILHLDICPITGEGLVAWNHGATDPDKILGVSPGTTKERNWETYVAGTYYIMRTISPSLRSIQEGLFVLADATDWGWKNINTQLYYRLDYELASHYPFHIKCMMEYNSSTPSTIFWGLMKTILPKQWTQVLEVGCQVECNEACTNPARTLTELYLQPNPQEAIYHVMKRARRLLEIRAANEATFRLS